MKNRFYYLLISTTVLCIMYYVYTTIDFTESSSKNEKQNVNKCNIRQLRKQLSRQLVEIKTQLDKAAANNQPPSINSLNALDEILHRIDPIQTISRANNAQDVCPEIFTKEKKWKRSCNNVKIDKLLTILLFPSPNVLYEEKCSTYVTRVIASLHKLYPNVRVIIANRHPQCYLLKKEQYHVQEVNFGTSKTDAVILNHLISRYVNTKYTFVARNVNHLNNFTNFERQISVFGIDSRVKLVGGAYRNISGHWKIGCYQSEMKNYVLEYKKGYHSSKNECMFCDFILSPFTAKTELLKEITFDESLANEVVFHDFFIRVRNKGYFILNCPDVMHFSTPNEYYVKDDWSKMALKYQLNYVIFPPDIKLQFSCSEIAISCVSSDKLTKTHLMPRCCIDDYVNAFKFLQQMAEKHQFKLELDSGSVLGPVKMRGVLPWDVDGDLVYLSSQHNIIVGLKSIFWENGFRLQVISDAEYSTKDFVWSGGYMMLWSPEQSLELYGMSYLSEPLLPKELKNITTKVEMNGVWIYAPTSPGLFVRNRYAAECLQHAHHWRQTGKNSSWLLYEAGVFNNCSKRGHHACVDRFTADGNLQFAINDY